MKILVFAISFLILMSRASSAQDNKSPFERIAGELKDFKPDTSAVPNDKTTKKIIELRNLRGGFNINEAIEFKIEEDLQKKTITQKEHDRIKSFFTTGNGKRWLDNAVIWIYRNHFTYKELKRLTRFYRSSAGQKLASEFPVIMLQTLAAGEWLKTSLK